MVQFLTDFMAIIPPSNFCKTCL